MGRPRKLDALTKVVSARVRPEQHRWLQLQAEERFEGDTSRALRWALDQADVFTWLLAQPDPLASFDAMLHPDEPRDIEEEIAQAERELEQWKREQAVKRARAKRGSP
jgi:hypothetical protein